MQVSSACVGCFARPCMAACPRQAITVVNQRSTIDRSKCIDCGKCMAVCPYHAIIRNPLPCEDACPVGAIGKGEDGLVKIDFNTCIYCGKCFRSCPFSTIMERSSLINILDVMESGRPVVAMVAPSVTNQFPGTLEQLFTALRMAGFFGDYGGGARGGTHYGARGGGVLRTDGARRPADDQQLLSGLGGSGEAAYS